MATKIISKSKDVKDFTQESIPKKKSFFTYGNIIIILLILLLLSIGAGVYLYTKTKSDPQKVSQEDLQNTIQAVSKLMILPKNETPTLATVSDPEKLKDQAFFANAHTGDKVLIYTNAKKAILYSPSENKIVEVSPLNISQ